MPKLCQFFSHQNPSLSLTHPDKRASPLASPHVNMCHIGSIDFKTAAPSVAGTALNNYLDTSKILP